MKLGAPPETEKDMQACGLGRRQVHSQVAHPWRVDPHLGQAVSSPVGLTSIIALITMAEPSSESLYTLTAVLPSECQWRAGSLVPVPSTLQFAELVHARYSLDSGGSLRRATSLILGPDEQAGTRSPRSQSWRLDEVQAGSSGPTK